MHAIKSWIFRKNNSSDRLISAKNENNLSKCQAIVEEVAHEQAALKSLLYKELKGCNYFSPFHLACSKGNLELVQFVYNLVLEPKFDPEYLSFSCSLALHGDHFQVCRFLFTKNEITNIVDYLGNHTVVNMFLNCCRTNNLRQLHFLFDYGAGGSLEPTILTEGLNAASTGNHSEITECLLLYGTNITAHAMNSCCEHHNLLLLKKMFYFIEQQDAHPSTALTRFWSFYDNREVFRRVLANNSIEFTQVFLTHSAPLNHLHILHSGCRRKCPIILHLLLDHGADFMLCRNLSEQEVSVLLSVMEERGQPPPTALSTTFYCDRQHMISPAIFEEYEPACFADGLTHMANVMLKRCFEGQHTAADDNCRVSDYLALGADCTELRLSIINYQSYTYHPSSLNEEEHAKCRQKKGDQLMMLVEMGLFDNKHLPSLQPILIDMCNCKCYDIARALVAFGIPLQLFTSTGVMSVELNSDNLRMMIAIGADINQVNDTQISPLLLACRQLDEDAVDLLLAAEANASQVDAYSQSALHYLSLKLFMQHDLFAWQTKTKVRSIAQKLIAAGADPKLRNTLGATAGAMLAREKMHIAELPIAFHSNYLNHELDADDGSGNNVLTLWGFLSWCK